MSAVKTPSNPRGSQDRKSQILWHPTDYMEFSCRVCSYTSKEPKYAVLADIQRLPSSCTSVALWTQENSVALNNFFLVSSSFYQPSCVLFSAEAVRLLSFSFTSFISMSILSIVSLKFLSITLLMFSSESENFKRYAHFHKQIYITASR